MVSWISFNNLRVVEDSPIAIEYSKYFSINDIPKYKENINLVIIYQLSLV